MAFIQFSQVSLAFGERDILKNVSVNLQTGSKAALTGANGSGKSTLIKVMAGLIQPDSGTRTAQKGIKIAYLPQSGLTHKGCTLMEEADKAFSDGYELQVRLDKIGDELKAAPQTDEKRGVLKALLEEHDKITSELEASGWNNRRVTAEQVLLGLGFSTADLNRQTEEFSGGWQMRIALAKSLMRNPDILLLDEPTNYLDIEAREWLEKFLRDFKGGFLLVSHDRYFLDCVINEVYELFLGNLRRYSGNFTHYERARAVELETLIREYEKQRDEIARLREFINRFGAKATKAAQAQERQKMLDKLLANQIVIPENLKQIRFKFPAAPHSGKIVLSLDGVTKAYGNRAPVINSLSLTLESGERLAVAGHNGAGKTTLLRIAAQEDKDFTGSVKTGAGVKIGYFSQDSAERLTGSQTVLDAIESECPLELIPKARDMLGAFLFRGDDVFKQIGVLSGGEKSRIALLRLLLRPVNLLVLDEPTNHLDMHSKDVLLAALQDFGGTVIFVSHDRGFLGSLATKVLELKPGTHRVFCGDYEYYVSRIASEEAGLPAGDAANKAARSSANGTALAKQGARLSDQNAKSAGFEIAGVKPDGAQVSQGRQTYEEQKRFNAEKRKLEKEVANIESAIAENEQALRAEEENLSRPEVYSNSEKAKTAQHQITALKGKLDALTAQWEKAALKLEEFTR